MTMGKPVMGMLVRLADIKVADGMFDEFEGLDVQVAAVGTPFIFPALFIWPSLGAQRLARTAKLRLLSYHNVADMKNGFSSVATWRRKLADGGEILWFCLESTLLSTKLTLIANMPSTVSAPEVKAMLPAAGPSFL